MTRHQKAALAAQQQQLAKVGRRLSSTVRCPHQIQRESLGMFGCAQPYRERVCAQDSFRNVVGSQDCRAVMPDSLCSLLLSL